MRLFYALFLILTFLFYHVGYYAIYLTSGYQIEAMWKSKVESGDLEGEYLQKRSISLTLPYQSDQESFTSVTGKVEIDGKVYRVVKQRYAKDTLHVIYLNDLKTENLDVLFNKWIYSLANKPIAENGGKVILVNFIKNYLPNSFKIDFQSLIAFQNLNPVFIKSGFKSPSISFPSPPPEFTFLC